MPVIMLKFYVYKLIYIIQKAYKVIITFQLLFTYLDKIISRPLIQQLLTIIEGRRGNLSHRNPVMVLLLSGILGCFKRASQSSWEMCIMKKKTKHGIQKCLQQNNLYLHFGMIFLKYPGIFRKYHLH